MPEFRKDADGVAVCQCETAKEMIAILSFGEAKWRARGGRSSSWVFRGQRSAKWKLTPSAMRQTETSWFSKIKKDKIKSIERDIAHVKDWLVGAFGEKFPQLQDDLDDITNANFIECVQQVEAERQAINRFVKQMDEVGYPVPIDQYYLRSITVQISSYLHQKMLSLLKLREKDNTNLAKPAGKKSKAKMFSKIKWDFRVDYPQAQVAALAQHHGIPTRLIDWTTNPLIAAYFAASEAEESQTSDPISVWALDRRIKDINSDIKFVTPLRSGNSYLHVQRGLFCYDMGANKYFIENGIWRCLEDVIETPNDKSENQQLLCKITLPSTDVKELLNILETNDIALRFMKPTLDNVAKDLMRQ